MPVAEKENNKRIAVLVNPKSGNGKALKIGVQLKEKLSLHNIAFSLFDDTWPADLQQFNEAWIVGGDGTMNYFLNHYKNIHIPLVLFKGGTGNDFAWKLYGNISLEEQFELVLTAAAKPVDVASCNGQLYLNSLGIGFDGAVLQSMGMIRWLGGHIGYLWVVIRKIFSFKEFSFTIKFADTVLTGKYLLVIANNSSRTGGGFMVTPNAAINDGKIDMVLCHALPIMERLKYLPVIEKGKHLDLPFIYHSQEKEIYIGCESALFAQLDGELIRSKDFFIKVLPDHIMFKY